MRHWLDGCVHYGTQFERELDRRDDWHSGRPPLYWRMRRHSVRYRDLWR